MITTDLDAWTAAVGAAMSLPATRDPDTVFPPCVFVGAPDALTVTIGEVLALDVPVFVVADGHGGKVASDWLLDTLPAFLTAVGQRTASPEPVTVDGVEHPAYRATARLHISPAPPPPLDPQSEGTLYVDLYAGSYVRVTSDPLLDDGQPHWVVFELATIPGPNGATISANGVAAHDGVAWFDHGGQLGHVTHAGTDLPNITLSNYIRQGRLALVHTDVTDPAHPALVITDVHNPTTP